MIGSFIGAPIGSSEPSTPTDKADFSIISSTTVMAVGETDSIATFSIVGQTVVSADSITSGEAEFSILGAGRIRGPQVPIRDPLDSPYLVATLCVQHSRNSLTS